VETTLQAEIRVDEKAGRITNFQNGIWKSSRSQLVNQERKDQKPETFEIVGWKQGWAGAGVAKREEELQRFLERRWKGYIPVHMGGRLEWLDCRNLTLLIKLCGDPSQKGGMWR